MAQRVDIVLIDDIDDSTADETVTFALDGVSYEIDLSAGNAEKLRDDFAHWIGHSRRSGGTRGGGRRTPAARAGRRADLAEVRAWARKNGFKVSDRGRVPAEVLTAFDAKH